MSDIQTAERSFVELQRIIDLKEAARLSGVSVDTLKRNHSHNILRLSPRRLGMRISDALRLSGSPTEK